VTRKEVKKLTEGVEGLSPLRRVIFYSFRRHGAWISTTSCHATFLPFPTCSIDLSPLLLELQRKTIVWSMVIAL
jgi:hypothetical protein